jgi:hypothetical protein
VEFGFASNVNAPLFNLDGDTKFGMWIVNAFGLPFGDFIILSFEVVGLLAILGGLAASVSDVSASIGFGSCGASIAVSFVAGGCVLGAVLVSWHWLIDDGCTSGVGSVLMF